MVEQLRSQLVYLVKCEIARLLRDWAMGDNVLEVHHRCDLWYQSDMIDVPSVTNYKRHQGKSLI